MTNKPKQIGTAGETLVARYAQANGFPLAERLALRGNTDHGDVRLCAGLHVEVKAGKAAENAGPLLISDWLEETDKEAAHSGATVVLVLKRKGCGAGQIHRWRAIFRLKQLDEDTTDMACGWAAVEMNLVTALELLRVRGFGTPLED
jgi:hypothetical protein